METCAVFGGNAKIQFVKQWKSLTVLDIKKHEDFIFDGYTVSGSGTDCKSVAFLARVVRLHLHRRDNRIDSGCETLFYWVFCEACVRLVEEAVLKTVGCNRFGGSNPSHVVLVSWSNGISADC